MKTNHYALVKWLGIACAVVVVVLWAAVAVGTAVMRPRRWVGERYYYDPPTKLGQ